MDYGTLKALFTHVPLLIGFLVLVYIYRRSHAQQPINKQVQETLSARPGLLQFTLLLALTWGIRIASSVLLDDRWDDLKHTFNIPARSIDALLLIGFAEVGVFSLLLLIAVIFINLYYKLTKR